MRWPATICQWLEANDAPASETLRCTRVHFHRRQRAFERLHVGPILRGDGDAFQVRLSPFTMAPHRIPFAHMRAFYRAYADFVRLADERAYRFALGAGDVLVYDNHRMSHGRTGFAGARWVRVSTSSLAPESNPTFSRLSHASTQARVRDSRCGLRG